MHLKLEFPEFKSFQMLQKIHLIHSIMNINYLAEYFLLTVKARRGKEKRGHMNNNADTIKCKRTMGYYSFILFLNNRLLFIYLERARKYVKKSSLIDHKRLVFLSLIALL